jgi:hypothetical protein
VKGQQPPNAVTVAAVLDAANYRDPDQYQFVSSLDASYYRDYQFDVSAADRHEQVVSFSKNPHSADGVYALTFAVAGCPIGELQDFLSSVLLPAFFNAYKRGKVMVLRPTYNFETRYSVMRAAYTASQYGRLDQLGIDENPFQTMERWQSLMPSIQLRLLLELATALFFPRLQYFTTTRSGLLSVFIPGEQFVEYSPKFPASWPELFKEHWDFAKGERHPTNLRSLASAASEPDSVKPILDKVIYDAAEVEALVQWLIKRYNLLAFHQTDPAEFLDDDSLVDFVTCFEHALTLDRALRKGMSSVFSAVSVTRKEAAMEIADIIGELAANWTGTNGVEYFKKLVHPIHGAALLTTSFSSAPASFATVFTEVAAAIYNSLCDTIIASVFVPTKKTSSGILVRNRALSSAEAVVGHTGAGLL